MILLTCISIMVNLVSSHPHVRPEMGGENNLSYDSVIKQHSFLRVTNLIPVSISNVAEQSEK